MATGMRQIVETFNTPKMSKTEWNHPPKRLLYMYTVSVKIPIPVY